MIPKRKFKYHAERGCCICPCGQELQYRTTTREGPVLEQIHAYLSTNWKELRNLPKDAPALVAKARDRWYVPDLNKAGNMEKLREKALLKELEKCKEVKKNLRAFSLEAVRTKIKKARQERDCVVIDAMADKIPGNVPGEDPKWLMWTIRR